ERKQATDREISSKYEVYSEVRWIGFDLTEGAVPGAVIAWEFELQMHGLLAQCEWSFQDELPVQVSQVTLQPPRGWSVEASFLHGAPVTPRAQQGEWTWLLRDLPSLIEEVASPPIHAIAPSLGLTWAPPGSAGRSTTQFHTWTDVGRWLCALADPQASVDEPLRQKTRTIIAGAPGDQERVERLGRFVQSLPYAEVSLDIDRGRGYQPRPAVQVFRQGYGDCK